MDFTGIYERLASRMLVHRCVRPCVYDMHYVHCMLSHAWCTRPRTHMP